MGSARASATNSNRGRVCKFFIVEPFAVSEINSYMGDRLMLRSTPSSRRDLPQPQLGGAPMTPQKHFSMIREFHLADFFTLANGACGIGAVFCAMKFLETQIVSYFLIAAALAP